MELPVAIVRSCSLALLKELDDFAWECSKIYQEALLGAQRCRKEQGQLDVYSQHELARVKRESKKHSSKREATHPESPPLKG